MFKFIKRIMGLSGEYRKKLDRAYVLSFFESLASNVPICMLLYVLMTIMDGNFGKNSIIIAFVGIFAGVILRMICRYLTDINQSGVGYEIFARERMNFGDRIKRFPMGFFSEDNIGNVTSVITNDISFVEEHGMDTLGKITTSVIGIRHIFRFSPCAQYMGGFGYGSYNGIVFCCIRCGSPGCFRRGCKSAGGTEQAGWNGH